MGGEIPVIDMQEIMNDPCKLREACEKWGCFRIVNHGVSKDLMAEIKYVANDLFDRPVEIKQRNKEVLPGSGYFSPSESNPVYEAIGVDIISSRSLPSFFDHLQVSPCQRVVNHGMSKDLMAEMRAMASDLFDRPVEIKQRNKEVLPGSGHVSPSESNPAYEAIALDICSSQSLPSFCSHLDASARQREIIEKYFDAIHNLANDIVSKMAGIKSPDHPKFKVWPSHFRMNKYTITQENVGNGGLPTHTDASLITILQDDEVFGGLEIVDPSGKLVPVDRVPGAFVVNLGDVVVPWSNGKLRSLEHRVVCKDVGIRLSIATIITPAFDEDIVAHPKFLEGDGPPKYTPFKYAELRKLRASKKLYAGDVLELLRCRN